MVHNEVVGQHVKTYHNNPKKGELALKRFEEVVNIIAEDEVAVSLTEKMLESAQRYFAKVVEMESRLKMARFRLEGEELRDLTQLLDKNRRMAHEALISNLHILNRYLVKEFGDEMPVGAIYSEDPESIRDRIAIGDWAGNLLFAIYQNRKR